MALISWGDEEEKKDDIFGVTPIKQIASVQSGAWQPAPSGANAPAIEEDEPQQGGIFGQRQAQVQPQPQNDNYLMSEEKVQVDQAKARRDAEIAEARRQAEARAAAAEEFRQNQIADNEGGMLDVEEIKKDENWKRFYDQEFKREKDGLDFWGRLMDGGGASRRAEVAARGKYNTELLNRAYDENGNVLDANAAALAKKMARYNSVLAEDNSTRSRAAGEAIGAFDKEDSGFWGRINDAVNAMRQMSAYDAVAGVDDKHNTGIDDAFRFGGNVIQGVATALPIGGKAIYEGARGEGTDYSTGFQKKLDGGERVGRVGSGAIDVVGTFFGGSGKLVQSLGTKVVSKTATQAEKTMLKRLTSEFIIPSLIEGGEAGAQAAAEYFGNDGTLLDENGEIDADKVAELLTQTGQSAAIGTLAGGVFTGTAAGVNRFRNRGGGANAGNLGELENIHLDDGNIEFTPVDRAEAAEGISPIEQPNIAEAAELAPVDTGVTPVTERIPMTDNTPAYQRGYRRDESVAPEVTPVPKTDEQLSMEAEIRKTQDLDMGDDLTPAFQRRNEEGDITPVADGVAQAAGVIPVRDGDVPAVRPEDVRALQESRAGKSQAEEAVINQQLMEAAANTPSVYRSENTERYGIGQAELGDGMYTGSQELAGRRQDGSVVTDDLYEYKVNPEAKVLDSSSDEFRAMDSKASNDPSLQGLDGREWQQQKAKVLGQLVQAEGYDAVKRGTNQFVAMSEKALLPVSENAPMYGRRSTQAPVESSPVPTDIAPVKEMPEVDSVPEGMSGDGTVDTDTGAPMNRKQVAERLMPLLDDASSVKKQIADAVDMGKDTESPVRDILREGGVKPKQAERVASQFDQLEKQLQEYNRLEAENQKAYTEGGEDALSPDVSRDRSRVTRDMGETMRRLVSEINRLEGSKDYKTRIINRMIDVIGTRNASVLTSAGLLERNIAQEISANLKLAIKNPVKMAKSIFGNGNILKDTAKGELSHWKDAPRSPIEAVKYIVGNIYRTAMIPTTALANTRRGAVREELTRWAYKELEGRDLNSAQAKKLSGTAGNEMEALVNTFIGVDNGMTNRKQATDALQAWKEYIRTGDDGAKAEFLSRVENHNSLADQMIAGLSKEDAVRARGLMAMKNLIFPFVRTATNLMKTTVKQDLNPFAKSLLDEVRADQRSGGANAVNLIKSKLVDYGIMGGAAALAGSGALVYNDGDEVDKPKGWSLKIGDNQYVPIRATSVELPIALAGTAQQMASDIASGNAKGWQHYAGMVTGSLPYIDQFNTTTGAVDSLTSGEDGGYAAKSYAVNTTKSFVPFSNNGVQPYVAGKQGESLNAKTVYDDNIFKWLENTVRKSYDPDFYNSLKDSRDNAGRVRTVDNQGVVSNKTMNDAGTAEFNDRIDDLVEFGRKNDLGKGTKDMFNTYDTGKNNNFKSVQDSITFLDAVDGKPDNAKKLEKNAKLDNLAQQIRNGFFGDSGSELLTLDGKNLYSDVSVPGKYGGKNTRLPISMESIQNAIAQTDLPEDQRNALYEIGQQKNGLYERRKAGEISYEQEQAMRSEIAQQEQSLMQNSESYQKMLALFDELEGSGFFENDGLGSTRSGQTYLWNSLNALLGSKGATPAANYPDSGKGFTPWGSGKPASNKPGDRGNKGIQWTPVGRRQMAGVKTAGYTPVSLKVKLGNEVKKDRSQNYSDRNF